MGCMHSTTSSVKLHPVSVEGEEHTKRRLSHRVRQSRGIMRWMTTQRQRIARSRLRPAEGHPPRQRVQSNATEELHDCPSHLEIVDALETGEDERRGSTQTIHDSSRSPNHLHRSPKTAIRDYPLVEYRSNAIPDVIIISPEQPVRRTEPPAVSEPQPHRMELSPGEYRTLRTTQETVRAIQAGRVHCTGQCGVCDQLIFATDNVNYVICPGCRTVNPTYLASSEDAVGLGFTEHTLQKIRRKGSA